MDALKTARETYAAGLSRLVALHDAGRHAEYATLRHALAKLREAIAAS